MLKTLWKNQRKYTRKTLLPEEDLKDGYLMQIPGEFLFVRAQKESGNDWKITQVIDETDIKLANKFSLESIAKGTDALIINAKNIHTLNDLQILLEGIDLQSVNIRFENHIFYPTLAELFIQYIENKKYDKNSIEGSFNYDPIFFITT